MRIKEDYTSLTGGYDMERDDRSKDQIIKELRKRIVELEKSEIERKRTEKALKESEELYRLLSEFNKELLENSPAGIVYINKEINVEYENSEMRRILGLPLGKEWETIGMNIKDIPLIKEAGISSIFDDLMEGKEISEETSFTFSHGEKGYLTLRGVPLFEDSKFIGAVLIVNDITERKKVEEALKESEERYRTLVGHAYDWIWTLDKDGNFTYFNEAAEKGSGYKFEEGKGTSFVPIIVPEDLPRVQEIFAKTLKGETQTYSVRIYDKNKEIVILEVNTVPIMKEEEIVGTVSVGRDVTERKRLEEQREKARKEAEFYADVLAHDVSNIDQITLGHLYLLENAKDEEIKRKNIDGIKKSVMKSARLIDSLKILKKIEDTKLKKFDLNKSIERSVEKIKAFVDREIAVNLNIDKKYHVSANDLLDNVFFNLLENAVEFTLQDPVIIDIKTEERDRFCHIHICDRGIGISKEKKKDILENIETLSKRTGMGLYLVKKIFDKFNGKFEIKDVKKGTEIVIGIPMRQNGGSARNVHPQRSHKRNKRGWR